MKLQITSDLHLEYQPRPEEYLRKMVAPSEDNSDTILIAAGDIAWEVNGDGLLQDFVKEFGYKDYVYVYGNHEFYGGDITEFLSNDDNIVQQKIIDGVRFIGTPLYSKYVPLDPLRPGINDFYRTSYRGKYWTVDDHVMAHNMCVKLLEEKLNSPFEGTTAVVTHFLPSYKSVDNQYFGSPLNNYFATNLDHLMEKYKPEYWIHGHTHTSCDYMLDNTRVICNPAGYFNGLSLELENKYGYDRKKIIDL